MLVPSETAGIVVDGRFFLFLEYVIPNLVSKVPNYPMGLKIGANFYLLLVYLVPA
jgi:hypothetical protein